MANDQGTYLACINHVEASGTTFATTTEDVGDRVLSNVATTQSDDFWRVDGLEALATEFVAEITLSEDKTIEAISVQFPRDQYPGVSEDAPNFIGTDRIRITIVNEALATVYSSDWLDSDVAVGYMIFTHKLAAAVSGQKVTIEFDATSRATAGFCDVAHIGIWEIIEPNIGFAYPGNFGWRLNTQNQRTPAGRLYTSRFDPLRRWTLIFDALSNDESMSLDEMLRYSGGARQMLVRRGDLPTGKDAMLCVPENARDIESQNPTLRKFSATFEEFI